MGCRWERDRTLESVLGRSMLQSCGMDSLCSVLTARDKCHHLYLPNTPEIQQVLRETLLMGFAEACFISSFCFPPNASPSAEFMEQILLGRTSYWRAGAMPLCV